MYKKATIILLLVDLYSSITFAKQINNTELQVKECADKELVGKHRNMPNIGKIILMSIPKSGSHLLSHCVQLITGKQLKATEDLATLSLKDIINLRPNQFLVGHQVYMPEYFQLIAAHKLRAFFIIRDPRDQVVSMARWLKEYPEYNNTTISNIIDQLINKLHYEPYLPWMTNRLIYVTTFERLVGPKGGGSLNKQLNEIRSIAKHLTINLSWKEAQIIADQLFGQSFTFRKGQIGAWKREFNQQQKALFETKHRKLLNLLGYK